MEKASKDTRFIRHLSILTLVVTAASIALKSRLTPWWPAIVLLFLVVSFVMYFMSQKAKAKGMRQFSNFYMASTVVKMVIYLAIILIYSLKVPEDRKTFAITFLAYYLIYSVFETYKLAKKDKKTNE